MKSANQKYGYRLTCTGTVPVRYLHIKKNPRTVFFLKKEEIDHHTCCQIYLDIKFQFILPYRTLEYFFFNIQNTVYFLNFYLFETSHTYFFYRYTCKYSKRFRNILRTTSIVIIFFQNESKRWHILKMYVKIFWEIPFTTPSECIVWPSLTCVEVQNIHVTHFLVKNYTIVNMVNSILIIDH